jgi:hypothetical protein
MAPTQDDAISASGKGVALRRRVVHVVTSAFAVELMRGQLRWPQRKTICLRLKPHWPASQTTHGDAERVRVYNA